MLQIHGVEGEAIVNYCKPSATQIEDPGFLLGDAVLSAFPMGKQQVG